MPPLPGGVTLVPFHGEIVGPDGVPAVGIIELHIPQALRDHDNNVVVGPGLIRARLDASGEFTLPLPATDDPDITPTGWAYEVIVSTDVWVDRFYMVVPADTVGTLELSDVAPATTPTDVVIYALATHAHTLDSLSDVNVATASNGQFLSRVGGVWVGVNGAGGGVTDHGQLTGLGDDDHPQYLTAARGDLRYYVQSWVDTVLNEKEDVGVAATLLAAHTAAADPHPQYTTSSEVTTALGPYATTASLTTGLAGKENTGTAAGLLAAHTAAADPHPQYATDTDLAGKANLSHTHTAGQVTDFATAVDARITPYVGSPPAGLNSLEELADALGDDPAFHATMATALAGKQPLDADLTTIAGLSAADDTLIQRTTGVWAARTPAQVKSTLALAKGDVGLGDVDNTSDLAKPVSTATQAALTALTAGLANRGVQATASSGIAHAVFTGDTSGAWTLCPAAYRVTIPAVVGDVLQWEPHLLINVGADAELDVASVVTGAPVRYFSSGTTVQGANGHGGLYIGTVYNRALKAVRWIVTADDLDSGSVTLALMYRSGAGVTFGHAVYPGQVDVTNYGTAA